MFKLTNRGSITDPESAATLPELENTLYESMGECLTTIIDKFRYFGHLEVSIQGPDKWIIKITPIRNTYYFTVVEVTFRELADAKKEELKLDTYDTAIPMAWSDDVKAKTGEWPSHFVWGYGAGVFGFPVPLTPKAEKLLEAYNASK